jgi:hypothetical protein
VNGRIRAYTYFPLSTVIIVPGAGVWSEDLTDTLRTFPNTMTDHLPAGTFRFAARCLDDAGAESPVDAGQFRRGVSQVVVNWDPETWMTELFNWSYKKPVHTQINFTDNLPDTVPYKSWTYFRYYSHDDARDGKVCFPGEADECINFQIKVVRESAHAGSGEDSGWLPRQGVHDSELGTTADSNTVNMASYEYDLLASGVDENGTRDGTPATVHLVGNFAPTMDTFLLDDHLGNPVNTAVIDTLVWDFYKGIGWPYDAESDTVQADGVYYKYFGFNMSATGHDDIRDPAGSAVGTWSYNTYTDFNSLDDPGTSHRIGRTGVWFEGDVGNEMFEETKFRFRYNEADGDDLFADLSAYPFLNQVITLVVYGRDTKNVETAFDQFVFWNQVPPGASAGNGISTKNLINSFNPVESGRWTEPRIVQFYLRFTR